MAGNIGTHVAEGEEPKAPCACERLFEELAWRLTLFRGRSSMQRLHRCHPIDQCVAVSVTVPDELNGYSGCGEVSGDGAQHGGLAVIGLGEFGGDGVSHRRELFRVSGSSGEELVTCRGCPERGSLGGAVDRSTAGEICVGR